MFDAKEYNIEISKLSKGNNTFEFEVDKELFEFFECTEVNDIKATISVSAIKSERLIEFKFNIKGILSVDCSRCLTNMTLQIDKKSDLYVKIGHLDNKQRVEEIDVNEWILDENEDDIDLSKYIYEELRVEIPIAPVHKKKSDCDEEMLNKLLEVNKQNLKDKEEFDPRWEKLKSLIKE